VRTMKSAPSLFTPRRFWLSHNTVTQHDLAGRYVRRCRFSAHASVSAIMITVRSPGRTHMQAPGRAIGAGLTNRVRRWRASDTQPIALPAPWPVARSAPPRCRQPRSRLAKALHERRLTEAGKLQGLAQRRFAQRHATAAIGHAQAKERGHILYVALAQESTALARLFGRSKSAAGAPHLLPDVQKLVTKSHPILNHIGIPGSSP